ncbi:hypothetical protein GQX73_g6002 [Xylaria multiplex]|uniref:Arb2 domain-containing protein n=1 Tax=Xylaria multiplex TaxID=323545 RepID=A0A7C8ML17_9PEZI|nr:hypothetical protein GQX73_g6002 [Xylaria multiplex]
MFRRKWPSLPEDVEFPSKLHELGYHINEDDEIRNVNNPDDYFKYFIDRNPRINDRQRFAMNLVIFGETEQDLGVLAHRVLGGPGGINKGSMVSVVKALTQRSDPAGGPLVPGIRVPGAPMRSAAHSGNYVSRRLNRIPGNESPAAHVKYFFEQVIPSYVKTATLDIIGLGDGADVVMSYLNSDETWRRVGHRINCFASVGGQFPAWEIKCDGLREFVKERARAYVPSAEPLGLVLSGDSGNPHTTTFTSFGCPVFSAGETQHVETLFIASYPVVLDWLQEVADTHAQDKPYKNPAFTVTYSDVPDDTVDWVDCKKELAEESVDGADHDVATDCPSQEEPVQEAGLGEAKDQNQDMQAQCQVQMRVTAAALSQIPDATEGKPEDDACSLAATDGGSVRSELADVVQATRTYDSLFPSRYYEPSGPSGFTYPVDKGDCVGEVSTGSESADIPIPEEKTEEHERDEKEHEFVVVMRPKGNEH